MTHFFAKTQYPQHTWLNGGQGSDARKYWFVYTQRTPNGPRIDAVTSLQSAGDFGQVYSTSTTYYRVQRADDGTAAAILDWTPRQVWHAATEQILRGGRRGTFKLTAYSDVTGEDREMPCPFGRVTNGTAHFYGNIAQDGAGNVYYGTTESVSQTWRLNPTTEVWTQLANTPSYSQLGSMMEWFPEANSGSGGLIKSLDFATSTLRVILLNAAGDTWSTLNSAVPNSQHALLCYHPSHARVLVVGGTNTQTAATFLEADGTATASSTACPANVHGMSPAGWVIAHPSGCWLVRSGADLHVYAAWPNDTYDDLTWQDLGAAPDAALSNPTVAVDTARGTYGTALITAESGLYAWALPAVADPSGAASVTPANGSATVSAIARALSVSAISVAVAAASVSATGASQAAASATAAVGAASVSVVGISFAAAAATSANGAAAASSTARSNAQASATAADGVASVSAVGTSVGSGTALFTPAAGVASASAVGASTAAATATAAAGIATVSAVGSSSDGTTYATPSAAAGAASASAVGASQAVAAITAAAGVATVSAISGGAQPLSAPPAKQRLQSSSRGANLQTSRRPLYRGGSR